MNKLNVVLLAAASASGFVVVTVQGQARRNYMVLDKAQKQGVKLEQDYTGLKLGQAKSSNHKLIKVAVEKRRLQPPSAHDIVMVEYGKQ